MLKFYASVDEEDLMKVCSELKFLSICFQDINIFQSKQEYLLHYENKKTLLAL